MTAAPGVPGPGLPAPPESGTRAPDLTARNQHGETVTLSALRGRPVVLVFFPWAFSGICGRELADLQDALPQVEAAGARLLAVSCDAVYTLRALADADGLTFDLLSDHWPHGAVASAYGVFDPEVGVARRGSFVLDADGTVTWRVVNGIGEARDIAAHLAALQPAG